ncbi:hypothetical protein CHS0354_012251 [Potamilus streckersoni]|uniref:Deleted in lung and esophageal cancer protein 1 n=1 Tax=Potamilus streckersoni TaxID=2493646 RepID=A0AAE0SBB7_9BIVA|nr:hypothetical protein CHS0354_012251 [Potamilus streckersoni]
MLPLTQPATRGEEPSMFLHRPSVEKSQDVRHILAKTFRELFTRDAIGLDTVKNLSVSKGGDDPYHEKYVEALQKVFDERQRRLDEAAMLERHIMQAQARAMSADERALNRDAQSCDNYHGLGLPPGLSHFRSCLDANLLRKHKLLTPEDYATGEPISVSPPTVPKVPSYARETMTSRQHTREGEKLDMLDAHITSRSEPAMQSIVSEEIVVDEEPKHQKEALKEPRFRHEAWKEQLSSEERELDRAQLALLDARVNYLRNPRFIPPSAPPGGRSLIKPYKPQPKEIGIQTKPELTRSKEPSTVFLVSPPVLVFRDYKMGQVYEQILEVKNVSAVIRQCQAFPPSTVYFYVGLGQFPGEHGLIAPGMSCKYAIRFAPDSLKDFDDEIQIQTQSSTPIVIPLQGRRASPRLTLPATLDIGYSLVGGCQLAQFILKNEGGSGRFCIMPKTSWPTTSFKSSVNNGSVHLPPFEIRPSVLELLMGETGVIEVVFCPPAVKTYTQEFVMVCDNCHVKHFTLKGEAQRAGVELNHVERGTSEPKPGELIDATAQNHIKFDDLNPFTYTDRTIVVKNLTNVNLPFQWMIYKPQFDSPGSESAQRKYDRVPDVDSVFSVHPPSGYLTAAEKMEFKITFAPPAVSSFHSVLHLLLNMVPPNSSEMSRQNGSKTSSNGDEMEKEDEDNLSEILLNSHEFYQLKDFTALEVEVKGRSVPLNVVIHPYAVYLTGPNLIGSSLKKMITMANHSRSTITFQWEPFTDKYILEVEPPFGELDPGMAMDMELSITGVEPGKIDHTLYCYVMNMDEPLHLHVECEFKGPEVSIEEPDINLGLIRFGNEVSREITLCNMAQMISKWVIRESPELSSSEDSMAESDFKFEPAEGKLKPLERKKIKMTFKPTSVKSVKTVVEVSVEDGNECHIGVYGEVQIPQVCFMTCELNMAEVYKDVPRVTVAKLLNQTLLLTRYEFGQVEGRDAEDCYVDIVPKKGNLNPHEERQIAIHFTSKRVGEFSELRIPCYIEGLENPLYLALFCDVKGLGVTYSVSQDGILESKGTSGEMQAKLYYGDVDIGVISRLYLHISNESAISAPFSVTLKNFFTKPPTPPSKDANQRDITSIRRTILGKTPNLADPLAKTASKAHADLCQAMLTQGQGIAFVPVPASGILTPFGEEVIEITAYNDMWGEYFDEVICKIGELEATHIPVSINIHGCPLSFQMMSNQKAGTPVLRFGSHIAGTAVCNRSVRVNNNSPYAIRIDWEMFRVEEEDEKLIDMVVNYGQSFPLRDVQGNEIVPQEEGRKNKYPSIYQRAPPKLVRHPTDFIPNSTDSTPITSRQQSAFPTVPTSRTETIKETESAKEPGNKNVVSVFCRIHEGKSCTSPFSISPRQLVIPPKGNDNITVSFTPFPTEEVTTDINCFGYALGYMSLDEPNVAEIPGKVKRLQGYKASKLHLDMTTHVKPALLTIEPEDEEGMRYRTAMSDLLQENGTLKLETLKICSVMLSNLTLTPLTFRLVTKRPFCLVELDPSSNPEKSTRAHQTDFNTLKPRHNLIAKVAFITTTDLLSEISDKYLEGSNDESDTSKDIGGRVEVKDNLIVEFNNTAQQVVPLHATLVVPQLELSKESLDFGTCLVGQLRELQLMIFNNTSSHTNWSVSIESRSDTCALDTFRVDPSRGLLEAHITYVSNSKCLLHVFFVAK